MTTGEKISKLRKENNYTQEQLADILGVSRQSISKWESDVTYPETDKLIKMGKLFDCSMDYLLKDDCADKSGIKEDTHSSVDSFIENVSTALKRQMRERKSEKTVCGMPLYHIAKNAHGFFAIGLNAKGVFAIGLKAQGIVTLGLLSIGLLSFGLLGIGLIGVGAFALGIMSVGSISLGLFSVGAISIGIISIGALSIGEFSTGALAIGKYFAIGDNARAMIAVGDTEAIGSVYSHIGKLSAAELTSLKELLNSNIPSYFAWAKDFMLMFLP